MRRTMSIALAVLVAGALTFVVGVTPARAQCPMGDGSVPGSSSSVIAIGEQAVDPNASTAGATIFIDDRDYPDLDSDGIRGGLWIYLESGGGAGLQRGGGPAIVGGAWDDCLQPNPDQLLWSSEGSVGPPPPAACHDFVDNDGDGRTDYPLDPGCSSLDDNYEGDDPPPPDPGVALLGCDDGLDNDADGRTDTTDPGCSSSADTDERGTIACDDGGDNDGDLRIDYPADPDCTGPSDPDEAGSAGSPGACADGIDNDLDTAVDYPADPGCSSSSDTSERGTGTCDNGADNDGDGQTDYPADPGCSGPSDSSERGALPCDDGFDNDADGAVDYPSDPGCRTVADPNETTIP